MRNETPHNQTIVTCYRNRGQDRWKTEGIALFGMFADISVFKNILYVGAHFGRKIITLDDTDFEERSLKISKMSEFHEIF